jgi:hypothetical protein
MGEPLDLLELRRLLAASLSPAPWLAFRLPDGSWHVRCDAVEGDDHPIMHVVADIPQAEKGKSATMDAIDAKLIAAARSALPALLDANERLHAALDALYPRGDEGWSGYVDRLSMEFYRETHVWPPGKDAPLEMHHEHDEEERRRRWQAWLDEHRAKLATAARRALGKETGP